MEGIMQQVNEKKFDRKSGDNRNRNRNNRKNSPRENVSEIESKLVNVNRVSKVVKGGRTLRFSALVVVGDKKGRVGIGMGKATEVPNAIEKATENAKKNMVSISLFKTTIPHEIKGKFGKSTVVLLPAKEGAGVAAGGSVRAVVELCGIKDLSAKVYGSRNKINTVKATLDGLLKLKTKKEIAFLRGKTVEEI